MLLSELDTSIPHFYYNQSKATSERGEAAAGAGRNQPQQKAPVGSNVVLAPDPCTWHEELEKHLMRAVVLQTPGLGLQGLWL